MRTISMKSIKRVVRMVSVLLLALILATPQQAEAAQKSASQTEKQNAAVEKVNAAVVKAEDTSGKDAVTWLNEMGFISSSINISKIIKKPDTKISRQNFIAILVLAAGADIPSDSKNAAKILKSAYADSKKVSEKLINHVAEAYNLGILEQADGAQKIKIRPESKLTKQMAAYYVCRCLNMTTDLSLEGYSDYKKVNEKCIPYLTAAVKGGLIKCSSTKKIGYKSVLTWKTAAEMIKEIYEAGYFDTKTVSAAIKSVSTITDGKMGLESACGIARDDTSKTLYVVDSVTNQIKYIKNKKVSVLTGIKSAVTDLNGRYIGGYTDDVLEKARFNQPSGLVMVKDGLLVTDTGNNVIRFVDLVNKTVSTYAGNGNLGSADGERLKASFNSPSETAVSDSGIIYVADTGNNCIRKIDTAGNITTYAGLSHSEGYKDGDAAAALFNRPTGLAVYGETVYVADCGNQRIRMIKDGMVTTVAGSGTDKDVNSSEYIGGFKNGEALKARFYYPTHITTGENEELYVSDTGNKMIRKITNGQVTTIFGFGSNAVNGSFDWSQYLDTPGYLMYSWGSERLYVSDSFLEQLNSFKLK